MTLVTSSTLMTSPTSCFIYFDYINRRSWAVELRVAWSVSDESVSSLSHPGPGHSTPASLWQTAHMLRILKHCKFASYIENCYHYKPVNMKAFYLYIWRHDASYQILAIWSLVTTDTGHTGHLVIARHLTPEIRSGKYEIGCSELNHISN